MAGVNRDTMDDLEDGEISGSNSDSEMGTTVDVKPQVRKYLYYTFLNINNMDCLILPTWE